MSAVQRAFAYIRQTPRALLALPVCLLGVFFMLAAVPYDAYADSLVASGLVTQEDAASSSSNAGPFLLTPDTIELTDDHPLDDEEEGGVPSFQIIGDTGTELADSCSSTTSINFEDNDDYSGIKKEITIKGDGAKTKGLVKISYYVHWRTQSDDGVPELVEKMRSVLFNHGGMNIQCADEPNIWAYSPITITFESSEEAQDGSEPHTEPDYCERLASQYEKNDGETTVTATELIITGLGDYEGQQFWVGYQTEYDDGSEAEEPEESETGEITKKDETNATVKVDFGLGDATSQLFTGKPIFSKSNVSVSVYREGSTTGEKIADFDSSFAVTIKKEGASGTYTSIIDQGTYKITVAPTGTEAQKIYGGSVTKTLVIKPRSVEDEGVSFTFSTLTYSGAAQTPTPSISIDGTTINGSNSTTTLRQDTDYTITYSNNINAGTAKAVVVGSNNLAGTKTFEFKISPRTITSSSPYVSWGTVTYTGSAIQAVPSTVTYYGTNTITLVKDKDYSLSGYTNNVNAGTATVTMKGIGNFTGEVTKTFTISGASVANATVGSIADKTYTGKEIKPVPSVTVDGRKLVYDRDFTINYYSNTNVGTAYGYIYGKGNYTSSKYVYPMFNIVGKPISKAKVASIPAADYSGTAYMPQPVIKYGSTTLTQGTDYALSYANNVNPGTATLTITGKGSYAGTMTKKFKVKSTGTAPKLTATKAGSGRILLSWNPIYGATKYAVYEKMPDGSYNTLKSDCTYTYGSVSNLSATRTHRFLVRAYVNNKWSSKSDKYLAKIKPTGAVKPSVRAASASDTSITLSWSHVPGASFYAIYEREGSKGSFTMRTNTFTGTSASLTGLKKKGTYMYYVRAKIDGKWSSVKKSDYVTISPADPNSPAVTAQAVAGKKGKVKLVWGKVRGATKYLVQAKQGSGKWKTFTKSCKKTTYTLSKLASKKKYTFRVRAYANGRWSKWYSDLYVTATPD